MDIFDDALEILHRHGFYAQRRDWALGQTLVVSRGTIPHGEMVALDGVIYLVWNHGLWDIHAPLVIPGGVVEHDYAVSEACARAMEYLKASQEHVLNVYHAERKTAQTSLIEYQFPNGLPFGLEN